MQFSEVILQWYAENGRALPWRESADPYKIWVSEIILQQTRVAQGMDYYRRFVRAFPTVEALAEADEDEVMHQWARHSKPQWYPHFVKLSALNYKICALIK